MTWLWIATITLGAPVVLYVAVVIYCSAKLPSPPPPDRRTIVFTREEE